jgi:hypothetical protein
MKSTNKVGSLLFCGVAALVVYRDHTPQTSAT